MFGLFKQVFHTSEQETIEIFEEKINVKYEEKLCASFKVLSLTNSNLSDLRPLSSFINLEILNLSNNNISNISALKNLKDLKIIDLRFNQLNDLPSWISKLKKPLYWERKDEEEEGIFLEGNPLKKSFFSKVMKREEEVKLEQLFILNTQHLTVCLPQSLNSNFLEDFLPNKRFFIQPSSNFRLNMSVVEYDENELLISNREFLEESNYILLVLPEYEECCYHEIVDFFIQKYSKNKLFLVLKSKKKVQKSRINKYRENFLEIFYTYNGQNIEEIRDSICTYLESTKEAKSLWRKNWIELKNEIEELSNDVISLEDFHDISNKYLLNPQLRGELLAYLIKIGSLRLEKRNTSLA